MNAGQGPDFAGSIQICFNKYVDFQGRASRAEYWWWTLFVVLVSFAVDIVRAMGDGATHSHVFGILGLINLALFLPSIAVAVRRLHDLGKSGWWYLLALIPVVGWIILLIWYCQRGAEAPNQYGTNPLMSRF